MWPFWEARLYFIQQGRLWSSTIYPRYILNAYNVFTFSVILLYDWMLSLLLIGQNHIRWHEVPDTTWCKACEHKLKHARLILQSSHLAMMSNILWHIVSREVDIGILIPLMAKNSVSRYLPTNTFLSKCISYFLLFRIIKQLLTQDSVKTMNCQPDKW